MKTFLNSFPGRMPALRLAFALLLAALVQPVPGVESPKIQPFPGVVYWTETRQQPPTRLFIAEIQLTNAQVHVRVAPGGPDPDGWGPWQTTLMTPTRIAAREGFDLAVNGDFFDVRGVRKGQGTNGAVYRTEIPAAVLGPAVTDGKIWAASYFLRPCLIVRKNGKARMQMLDRPGCRDWQVLAGNTFVLKDGAPVPHRSKTRHPRTVVGLDASGTKLVLLVADGRKPGVAVGMTYAELAAEMLRLGCRHAINLDGGGSSVMAIREGAGGQYRILNEPTDGRQRAVANVVGISVGPSGREKP